MKKLYFTLLILGQCAFAQNEVKQDTTKSQELENVFVTANRTATLRKETPVAISKITAKTINHTPTKSH
jgi:outer membrane cobalamin receptor